METPKDSSGEAGGRFPRFVVAHGLAAPRADLQQIRCRLPREVETGVLPRPRGAAAPVYLSSKELT